MDAKHNDEVNRINKRNLERMFKEREGHEHLYREAHTYELTKTKLAEANEVKDLQKKEILNLIRRLNKSLLTNAYSVFRQNNYIEMTADFKAKKLTEIVPETEVAVETKVEYKVYSER